MKKVPPLNNFLSPGKLAIPTAGFTLLETLVVIVMVGVVAAIAAPSWLGFVTQQRLNRAHDQVLQAIRTAQSEAKRTGTYREARFNITADPPQVAIVPVSAQFAPNLTLLPLSNGQISTWQSLGQDSISPGVLQLKDNNPSSDSIIFSPKGTVVPTTLAPSNPVQLPYVVTVSLRTNSANRRCIRVESLLGAISQGSNAGCP